MSRLDNKVDQVLASISAIHATAIKLKEESSKALPMQTPQEVLAYPKRGSMDALTSRLTDVSYRGERKYPSDLLMSIFAKELLVNQLTWPSPQ